MSKIIIAAIIILLLGVLIYSPNIVRLYKLANLYNEKSIAKNFINIDKIFDNTSKPLKILMFLKRKISNCLRVIILKMRGLT
jgi:hypothetical protein